MAGPEIPKLDDVVDADFVTIGLASVEVRPAAGLLARPQVVTPSADGMAMLSRAAISSPERGPAGPMFWAGGAAVALAAFWVAGGHTLLGGYDAPAVSEANGLRIASVISRVDRSGMKPVLLVDGKAINDGKDDVAMPPLHIQIVSAAGGSTLYKLGTAGQHLAGGDFFDFSSRLDLPKDGVRTVFVTFAQ
jgi:hypothetical protein